MGFGETDRNEFEWESAFREEDAYIASYVSLLKRFSDLPDCANLIARHLGDSEEETEKGQDNEFPDCDLNCTECSRRWDCDYAVPELSEETEDWLSQGYSGIEEGGADEYASDEQTDFAAKPKPGDMLYYENAPSFTLLRQTALAWCNVYATVLPAEARFKGIQILFHISRALTHLAASIGDGLYIYNNANIAFAKRTLSDLNEAVGMVNSLSEEHDNVSKLLETVRGQLLKTREMILSHLQERREYSE